MYNLYLILVSRLLNPKCICSIREVKTTVRSVEPCTVSVNLLHVAKEDDFASIADILLYFNIDEGSAVFA